MTPSDDKEQLNTELRRDLSFYGAACVKISWDDEKSDVGIERVSPFVERALEAITKCRHCDHEYIVTPSDDLDCPKCGFNFYWIDEASEKYSGPKFSNTPAGTVKGEN